MLSDTVLFTGNANPALAQEIARNLGVELGKAAVGRFSDGEVTVEIQQNVRGREVFVVQSSPQATVVWQTGDVVVALSCECSLSTLEDVAGQFPSGNDPGFVERVGDGFQTFASALGH